MRRSAVAIGSALIAAACTHPRVALPDGVPATAQARYRCDDGHALAVRFDNRADTATVTADGGDVVVLRGQRPASGIWYAGAGYVLRGKGDAARFDRPDGTGSDCRAD